MALTGKEQLRKTDQNRRYDSGFSIANSSDHNSK